MITVGVIGSGPVGRGLATLLDNAGYGVTLGTRHPDAKRLVGLTPRIRVAEFSETARADIVVLSVVHNASEAVANQIRELVAGKLVIDTDNAWIPAHYAAAGLHPGLTEGTWMARILPNSTVARAFSHIDWDLLVPYATGGWAAGYAIDGDAALLTRLVEDIGYVPVRVGSLAESGSVDPGGRFWSRMLTADAMRAELTSVTH